MKSVGLLEFCRDPRKALAAVRRGERVLLTHGGQPVAQLAPVPATTTKLPAHDALRRLGAYAVDGPGTRLPNDRIDRVVYGTPRRR